MGQESSTLQRQQETDDIVTKLNEEREIVKRIEEEYRKKHYKQVIEIMRKFREHIEARRKRERYRRGMLASMPTAVWEQRIGRSLSTIPENGSLRI